MKGSHYFSRWERLMFSLTAAGAATGVYMKPHPTWDWTSHADFTAVPVFLFVLVLTLRLLRDA